MIIHSLPWMAILGSLVKRFANGFHSWLRRENYWQIVSLVTQKSLFTVIHALFFIDLAKRMGTRLVAPIMVAVETYPFIWCEYLECHTAYHCYHRICPWSISWKIHRTYQFWCTRSRKGEKYCPGVYTNAQSQHVRFKTKHSKVKLRRRSPNMNRIHGYFMIKKS